MINSYKVWKEDKESEPKKKKARGKHKCIVCSTRFSDEGSLKQHMNSKHGSTSYFKYIEAIRIIEEEKRLRILELMK